MNRVSEHIYDRVRSGSTGYYEQKRGLIAIHGKEAVQFLDGLISNDVKTLEDGAQMFAAFPNAQGRLLSVVRVMRQDDRFLIETAEPTHQKTFDNLFRFTYAGDFFVEDISANYRYFSIFDHSFLPSVQSLLEYEGRGTTDYFVRTEDAEDFLTELQNIDAVQISDEAYEVLRIENGIPLYGVDMDETTIVPELGIDSLISYNKGCYIGQEIIARIHFRGHVAKRLAGLILSEPPALASGLTPGTELTSLEGKNAGRITSVTYAPKLKKGIALAFVRYDYLAEGTELNTGEQRVTVVALPFVN